MPEERQMIIGSDVSSTALRYAKARASLWAIERNNKSQVSFEKKQAGFGELQSFMFNKFPFCVDAEWKVFLEEFLTKWKIDILWSHLGVRNILLVGKKQVENQSAGISEFRDR
jgi:hypothetical protein